MSKYHQNLQSYNNDKTVKKYSLENTLQKGELLIFERYNNRIRNGKVLDVGVGGGRTTPYLAGKAKEYVGIDYAPSMIELCKEKFKIPNVRFFQCDARNLSQFENKYFDFVFFSFNGIDYIDFADRNLVFKETKRVLVDGGIFAFSTHNTHNIEKLYSLRLGKNPLNYFSKLKRFIKLRQLNGQKNKYEGLPFFEIYDAGEDFNLLTSYVNPIYQKTILEEEGFGKIEFVNYKTGLFVEPDKINEYDLPWLYYIAEKI
jgi:ubiquinone/menaquinone biosynthesis C-methylase UbiE